MNLHPTTKLERLIAAERGIKNVLAELADINCDAQLLLEEAVADVRSTMDAIAATRGDDHFPPRSGDAVLLDHNYRRA